MITRDAVTNKGVDIKATNNAMQVYEAAPAAYFTQFNRTAAGPTAAYSTAISSTSSVVVSNGACIYYGLLVLSSGGGTGSVNVWDGLTSAGTTWMPATAITSAGSFYPACGAGSGGMGVLLTVGLTVNQSSGAVVVPLFAPST